MKRYYFGVWEAGAAGHFLHAPGGSQSTRYERDLPFSYHILDGHLIPPQLPRTPGRVHRVVINGWTVLTFWDESGDSRPASNSAFVLEGVHTFATGLEIARQTFPEVFARFTFPLTEYTG